MGFVKRFFSRLFNRKSKLKKLAESPWIAVDATAADVKHNVPTSPSSPHPAPEAPASIAVPASPCLEIVLWQPRPLSVPPVTPAPLDAISRLRAVAPPLLSTAGALVLGSPPTVASLNIPVQYFISSMLYGVGHRREHALAPRPFSTVAITTSSVRRVEHLAGPDALIASRDQLQNLLQPTVASASSQSLKPQAIPTLCGAAGSTTNGVPSLVWSTTSEKTSYLETPEVIGHTFAPSFTRSVDVDVKAPKKIPRYPPGLGFPSEEVDDLGEISKKKPSLVPTLIIVRRKPSPVPAVLIDKLEPRIVALEHPDEAARRVIPSEADNGHERAGGQPEANEDDYDATDVYDAVELDKWKQKYGQIVSPFEVNSGPFKYRILSTIGRGGNGTVWHGRVLEGGNSMDVAIKVINTTLAYSRHVTDRRLDDRSVPFVLHHLIKDTDDAAFWIQQELGVLQRLGKSPSPFLSPLLHAFRDEQNFYFVMRYYPENLRQRLQHKSRKLHLFQLRIIAAEMVLALQRLHSKRVVHQDLKLENVLVSPNGHICICDFGNTAVFDETMSDEEFKEKSLEGVYGTDGYQAPELFTSQYNYKIDMWGLGLMLLELFLNGGSWYYAIPEFREIDPRFLDSDEPSPLDPRLTKKIYDPEARDLITKLLNNDPDKRPEWTAVKEHPFFTCHIRWDLVESRKYDPKYRACDADRERKPLIMPENWVRQQRPENAIRAMEEILDRAAEKKKGPGSLTFGYLPQDILEDECHGVVTCQHGSCRCDFPPDYILPDA